jgi:hypothetical protein
MYVLSESLDSLCKGPQTPNFNFEVSLTGFSSFFWLRMKLEDMLDKKVLKAQILYKLFSFPVFILICDILERLVLSNILELFLDSVLLLTQSFTWNKIKLYM